MSVIFYSASIIAGTSWMILVTLPGCQLVGVIFSLLFILAITTSKGLVWYSLPLD